MIKKITLLLFSLVLLQGVSFAKDTLQFEFPNEGWHRVESPDGVQGKKCYVPVNQSNANYSEMLIFNERIMKNEGLSPYIMLNRQLGKDRNNYKDIVPQYILREENNAMVAWCSQLRNTCSVARAFKGNEGIIFATYINRAPHYSQNIFGQWSNILALVKVYDKSASDSNAKNLIELD